MLDIEHDLNSEQLDVVLHGNGPCLVLAGAGSGKTRTITYRVAYLLERGVPPDNILLVTFTNKAAREMIDRVQALTKGEIRLPWSGTFHHIGYRILRKYAPLVGYKNNFTILDSEDSIDLMKLCLKQEGIDRKERRYPSASVMHSIISYARNAEMTIEDVLDLKHPKWLEIADVIGRIAEDYAKRKREANAMDFDDLLVNTHRLLLKEPSVKKKYSEQFQYVLVDEYQDTNKVQASLIRLFASHHQNILVVGDDAQSIYSFRAADIQNILSFEKQYTDAKIFRLETNYRSTPDILHVANEVIANNQAQYKKELKSVRDALAKPEVQSFADQTEEAEFIAGRILELRDEGVPLESMAVLFRAAFHSQAIELELNKRDILYDYRGGVRFFERAHVKDVLAYLRIVHNIEDTVAWSRVLNMQVGIGPAAAEMIIHAIKDLVTLRPHPAPLNEISSILPPRAQLGWNDFLSIWQRMENSPNRTPTELIDAILNSKYAEHVESEYADYRERLQDIEQLARFSEKQTELQEFLANASLQENYRTVETSHASSLQDEERIILSTIHQAKGLEWDAVFVMNLAAGQFPNDRSLTERQGLEEERRLFYVAVTRAKKFLTFSYPLMNSFDTLTSGPSMFLEEIDRELLDMPKDTTSDDVVYISEDEPFSSRPIRSSFLKSIDEL